MKLQSTPSTPAPCKPTCKNSLSRPCAFSISFLRPMTLSEEVVVLMIYRWTSTENVADVEAAIVQRTLAARRIGQVQDIAPIVAFLCDPTARWITGNVTCANGGLVLL